ncbi:MAG TPA: SagB/ThcOx family dehydrogenase [Anaerolineaceae bacterium]|nr:SagB/ThcOx family dehydrogenase [Anaerolineaceae bacterium]
MLDPILQAKIIQDARDFMKHNSKPELQDFESDQDLKKPQPPLQKARMRPEEQAIVLPRDFETLGLEGNLLELLIKRKSARVYTGEALSLLQLSFLLWATQGVKDIRGKKYATLRTVPSGGARHAFETYLLVQNVEGLAPGKYHYLAIEHQLEFLGAQEDSNQAITASLDSQSWAAKASVVFYWSFVPYRCEWRYGVFAHSPALIDAGHVGQNLYLACTALGLGTCAIAAFDGNICDGIFGLDGDEEFTVYASPVGTISARDLAAEKAFYQFVEDEGL